MTPVPWQADDDADADDDDDDHDDGDATSYVLHMRTGCLIVMQGIPAFLEPDRPCPPQLAAVCGSL